MLIMVIRMRLPYHAKDIITQMMSRQVINCVKETETN